MIKEVTSEFYYERFQSDPHPFLSKAFIIHNSRRVDRLVYLMDHEHDLGLVLGIKDNQVQSPFSAPFGGFHFRHEAVYIHTLDGFVQALMDWLLNNQFDSLQVTLPPDVYHPTFNAKTNSALMRSGFSLSKPDITNWINLPNFHNRFTIRSSREYLQQAVRHGLQFQLESDLNDQAEIHDIIRENRHRMRRPMYMSFSDLKSMEALWPVDYFSVMTQNHERVAGAILYRAQPVIAQAVYWGDTEVGRPLRAMDFLLFNLWLHYKQVGYQYIDLGISTEAGIPNAGLLRFKETHDCTSSLRFSYRWER